MLLHLAKKTPPGGPVSDVPSVQLDALNARFQHHSATDVMRFALREQDGIALVSSFGAESVALLHLAAVMELLVLHRSSSHVFWWILLQESSRSSTDCVE